MAPQRRIIQATWKEAHGRCQLHAEKALAMRQGEAREVQGLEGSRPSRDVPIMQGKSWENIWENPWGNYENMTSSWGVPIAIRVSKNGWFIMFMRENPI